MRAGALRHRLGIEKPVVSRTATGAETVTWSRVADVWASIEPLRGKETLQGNQVLAEMDTRIRIRWSPSVDEMNAKWRVCHRERIYDIKQIAHIGLRNREVEIMVSSGLHG